MSLARRIGFGEDESEAGQDPFDVVVDVVADGPRLKVNGSVVAAKRLVRAHAAEVRPVLSDATSRASTVLSRSDLRREAREEVASMLRDVMARTGVTCGDVGAALNVCERRVSEMRAGRRPVSVEHVLLVAERLPALRDALLAMLEERLRREGDE